MAKGRSEIDTMIEDIRRAISRCGEPEKMVYEALMSEAEGWKMRLEELEAEEQDPE